MSQTLETFTPRFPIVVDNTMRSAFAGCQMKGFWEFIRCLGPKNANVHLTAGKAYAKGLETARTLYYTGVCSAEDAMVVGAKELLKEYGYDPEVEATDEWATKNAINILKAYESYFNHWPMPDSKRV